MFDLNTHPLGFLDELLHGYGERSHGQNCGVLNIYDLEGKSTDRRFGLQKTNLSSFVEELAYGLKPRVEIGLASAVLIDEYENDPEWTIHIPMIDFAPGVTLYQASVACWALEQKYSINPNFKLHLYQTESSFHAYGAGVLLNQNEFYQWLADLLLIDPMLKMGGVADARWVGQSMRKGFMCLRLTHNVKNPITKVERVANLWAGEIGVPSTYSLPVTEPASLSELLRDAERYKGSYETVTATFTYGQGE